MTVCGQHFGQVFGDMLQNQIDMIEFVDKLREFTENEARSCSMDFGCITPHYVYRMWGGTVAYEEIVAAMMKLKAYGNR